MTDADESEKNGCQERIAEQLLKISSGRNEYKRLEEDTAAMAEKCYEQEIDDLRKQSKSVNLFLTCAVRIYGGIAGQ